MIKQLFLLAACSLLSGHQPNIIQRYVPVPPREEPYIVNIAFEGDAATKIYIDGKRFHRGLRDIPDDCELEGFDAEGCKLKVLRFRHKD